MSAFYREKVLSVHHWTDTLFSFRATRDSGFRFQNGQFAMIGLEVEGRPLLRAYSMASANHEEELEFFSIKVADGPLTSKLQKIREGDTILVGRKATGTLVTDNLLPGNRLLLLSTGTGLAPFASLIKDPDVYERFESIVLVHGCRQVSELAYGEEGVSPGQACVFYAASDGGERLLGGGWIRSAEGGAWLAKDGFRAPARSGAGEALSAGSR